MYQKSVMDLNCENLDLSLLDTWSLYNFIELQRTINMQMTFMLRMCSDGKWACTIHNLLGGLIQISFNFLKLWQNIYYMKLTILTTFKYIVQHSLYWQCYAIIASIYFQNVFIISNRNSYHWVITLYSSLLSTPGNLYSTKISPSKFQTGQYFVTHLSGQLFFDAGL